MRSKAGKLPAGSDRGWIRGVLALAAAGLAISIYLWMGKRGDAPLICGFAGGCVSVNASPYSEILGVPVAALGSLMYLSLLVIGAGLWRAKDPRSASRLMLSGFVIALAGALFSLYLTGIEAFVLQAYCMWCLISWVLITTIAILWARAISRQTKELVRG